MENTEVEKPAASEDASLLSRNRSFKSKQLVRSQAIRESTSPPRVATPHDPPDDGEGGSERGEMGEEASEARSPEDNRKLPVEIQITAGNWDEQPTEQRQRTKRWLGNKQSSSRDLLSNNPRQACVCGACHACPHCRGKRRRHLCPTKQDSGIVCSDDCGDCSDTENGVSNNAERGQKNNSLDVDDQTFYCRCPEKKEKPKSISLSRTDSDDKSEPTGPELVNFIKETLNKNARDRMTLLRIEKELHALVNDTGRCIVRFPVMTSYGRMLVHRCAALFQLSHHLDHNNRNAVLVSKTGTSGGRIPCTPFKQWCTIHFPSSPQRHQSDITHAKSILKRDTHSLDEPGTGALSAARSKSLEQREREYERVRRRIFSADNCNQDEASQWQWLNSGPVKLLTPEGGRNKLLKVQSLEGPGSSTGPSGPRGPVSKSHSFGGYGRGQADPPRVLSRQGDLASSSWRLSPSSSGYRTLSLHSTDSVTPSPTGGASPEPSAHMSAQRDNVGPNMTSVRHNMCVVWCVTELSSVPPGAALIHPQTGRPLTNPDGSVYHYDPANPPVLTDLQPEHAVDGSSDKKRGRLEKQHSFIDSECECQPSNECRNKCCCECRRYDSCHKNNTDKVTSPPEQKNHQKPPSPNKNRYEKPPTPTNHNPAPDLQTNHRPQYEIPTNQSTVSEAPTNQRSPYENQEFTQRTYEPQTYVPVQNFNPYDNANRFEIRPAAYDTNQKFELANQRAEITQRPMKLPTPEVQYIGQQFQQTFSHEEVTTPPVAAPPPQYLQPDLATQMAVKPMPLHDPNMAPMVVYGAGMTNSPLPVYGTLLPPQPEDKHPHRIDAHYPFPHDVNACSCCVPGAAPSYALYTPIDALQYQHYAAPRYQEQLQWANMHPLMPNPQPKMFAAPSVYPIVPPQYNVIYPQMLPQPYPVVGPAYPVAERGLERRNSSTSQRHSKRNSLSGSSRTTPLTTISQPDDKKVPYDDSQGNGSSQHVTSPGQNASTLQHQQNQHINNDSNEIAAKIQQIKEQMSQLNTRDTADVRGGEDSRQRRGGSGILGSHPGAHYDRFGRPTNDESQLTSAARAIVNSIRSMQAKNTGFQERRPEYQSPPRPAQFRTDKVRPEFRRADRPDRLPDRRVPVYRPSYLLRQMSPGTWVRRSPAPVHPVLNAPRRPPPDNRNQRR